MNTAYKKMLIQLKQYKIAYEKSPNDYLKGKIEAFELGIEYKRVDLLRTNQQGFKMPNLDRKYKL